MDDLLIKPRLTDYYKISITQDRAEFAIPFLDSDIPLFLDPFLLWKSPSQQDYSLHSNIILAFNSIGKNYVNGNKDEATNTLIALSEEFRKEMEPNSAPYLERIATLRALHDAGCKTWVSIEPYPTPNFVEQNYAAILNAVDFADKIIFGRLNYNKKVAEYKDYKQFFNDLAQQTINFCEDRNIDYHIKNGTITEI